MATTGHENEVVSVADLLATMKKSAYLGVTMKGTCSTAADTAAKTVQVGDGFALVTDAMVLVKFTNAISVAGATLNVNSKGAKPIYYRGAALVSGLVHAGVTLELRYNGSQWEIIGNLANPVYYNAATKGIVFPADNSIAEYDPNTKGIVFH